MTLILLWFLSEMSPSSTDPPVSNCEHNTFSRRRFTWFCASGGIATRVLFLDSNLVCLCKRWTEALGIGLVPAVRKLGFAATSYWADRAPILRDIGLVFYSAGANAV